MGALFTACFSGCKDTKNKSFLQDPMPLASCSNASYLKSDYCVQRIPHFRTNCTRYAYNLSQAYIHILGTKVKDIKFALIPMEMPTF